MENKISDGIPIDDPSSPTEGSDAGSSSDLREAYFAGVVERYRAAAVNQFEAAQHAYSQSDDRAKALATQALSDAVNGFWWSEGRPEEEALHNLLHEIGKWKRQNIGCELQFDTAGHYLHTCLVAAAHRRMGMSIGFVAKRICSICDQDLSECPHLRGRSYWIRGGSSAQQVCRVCMQEECAHRSDRLYRAEVISVIKDATVREVSLVSRPVNPGARILAVSVSFSELQEALGDVFEPGIAVNCDICLKDCPGFNEVKFGAHS